MLLHQISAFVEEARAGRLVFLAVGTSGLVYPAAGLVLQARAAGAEAWLVNAEPPDNARAFHHFVQGPSGEGPARALRVGLSAAVLAVAAAVGARPPAIDLRRSSATGCWPPADAFLEGAAGHGHRDLLAPQPRGPHDFFSEGDYWWPDPANPGGPYVRRDGQSNPDNFVGHRQALMRLSRIVPALAAAWVLTGEARYSEHAARHLRAWFVDAGHAHGPAPALRAGHPRRARPGAASASSTRSTSWRWRGRSRCSSRRPACRRPSATASCAGSPTTSAG